MITLDTIRRSAVAFSLLPPTALDRALERLGFVQAVPIRAPARAQDLTLRHRVKNYRAGDLERRYADLDIQEDVFLNYGFVTNALWRLMHPRTKSGAPADGDGAWPAARRKKAQLLLDFVRERGAVHPREVDAHFSHGVVRNYWGGMSNATTHLMQEMQYIGMLRVVRREQGIRIYAAQQPGPEPAGAGELRDRIDRLVDAAVRLYAPLPGPSLASIVRRLRYAVPQWQSELSAALKRAKDRLAREKIDGVDWYWPPEWNLRARPVEEKVRLLAPFDPVVWDRARFALLWGWDYRFEAYTPPKKRTRGYYAMPLLWRDRVIGWGNVSFQNGDLAADLGYIDSQPRESSFTSELEAELDRLRRFLQ